LHRDQCHQDFHHPKIIREDVLDYVNNAEVTTSMNFASSSSIAITSSIEDVPTTSKKHMPKNAFDVLLKRAAHSRGGPHFPDLGKMRDRDFLVEVMRQKINVNQVECFGSGMTE